MSEVRGRTRACKPIPPTYPNIVTAPWDSKEHNYTLTPEQLQEVFAKYGAPTMKLKDRPKSHYMSGGKKK